MKDTDIRNLAVVLLFLTTACQAGRTNEALCWRQKPLPARRFTPTVFKECLDAIKYKIIIDPKLAMVPQHFSRTPGKGFTVPYAWSFGNCVIQIDVQSADDEDRFRLYDIGVQATMINLG